MVRVAGSLALDVEVLLVWAAGRGIAPVGPRPPALTGVASLDRAGASDLAFCRFDGADGRRHIDGTNAGAVFVPESLIHDLPADRALYLPSAYPRLDLLHLLQAFWKEPDWEFDPAANPSVHSDAEIADDVRIGPFSVVGPDVSIGPGTRIGSNCHIEHAAIGRDVSIANSVAIGGVGFGYEENPETGEVLQFPHIGGVEIGDRVEIGSNTCLDRGSIGDTVIGNDCKIDNLIHIAHNVRMGERCKVIALAIVGGSVTLGDDAWIAPAAAIRDWRMVGEKAVVGLGAVVTKDVADGETVVGNPARPIPKTKNRYK